MKAKTVEVFFEINEEYINPNFTKEDALKNGEWNSVVVPENGLILLSKILSKNGSFWHQIRLEEKSFDEVDIDKVFKKTEKRNTVFKKFKGHHTERDEYNERIFYIDFFDEETNERVFKGTIKIGKKTRQVSISCDAFVVKSTAD